MQTAQPVTTSPMPSAARFGLKQQLMLALGLVSVLLAIVGVAAMGSLLSLGGAMRQAVEVDGQLSYLANQVAIQTLLCRRYEKDLFLNLADVKVRSEQQAFWNNSFADLTRAIDEFDAAATTPEDKKLVTVWRKESATYQKSFLEVGQWIAAGSVTSPESANGSLEPTKENIQNLTGTALDAAKSKAESAQQSVAMMEQRSTTILVMIIAFVLLSLIVAGAWSVLFPRRMMRPIAELQAATGRIAGGDMTARVELARNDELGLLGGAFNQMADTIRKHVDDLRLTNEETKRLQQAETESRQHLELAVGEYLAFTQQVSHGDLTRRLPLRYEGALGELGLGLNAMVSNLHGVTAQVQEATNAIASATAQILAVTTEQAASSAEQSAAITETATSVEEVKVIAQQTARQATQIAEVGQSALQIAKQGGQAIESTIGGMGQVRAQVRQIAQLMHALTGHSQAIGTVITTVSELADQINHLGRNVAIESTRSGKQDQELSELARLVRELAERSKGASSEVRELLVEIQQATRSAVQGTEQGSKGVEEGAALVSQAGAAIQHLAAEVEHGAQANVQMAAAAQQQMIGMEQIGVAMIAIQQATTQALLGTQQAEQAAQDLHSLAQSLQSAIATYRL